MTAEPVGKARGGAARAQVLSREKRQEIAKKAADGRWNKKKSKATHEGVIEIGSLKIPCAIIDNETRVLSQRGVDTALGRIRGGGDYRSEVGGEKLPSFLSANNLKPFIDNELMAAIEKPIEYIPPHGGRSAFGVEATLLPRICDVWLKARDAGVLLKNQERIAVQADIIMRGLAHVGIVALIDEATGYQRDRARDALANILEAFIAKELQPYLPTFPAQFYEQMFRLRSLPFPATVRRPQYFGVLTNNIIYDRLAPGVREELQRGVPRGESGRPKAKYFQKLTQNTGYPKLRELLGSVVTIMRLSANWPDFIAKLDSLHPKYPKQGENYEITFDYKPEEDDGRGI